MREWNAVDYYHDDPEEQGRGAGWYWWDEVWANSMGPYDTEEEADEACRKYADNL